MDRIQVSDVLAVEMIESHNDGLTWQQVAEMYNLKPTTVFTKTRKYMAKYPERYRLKYYKRAKAKRTVKTFAVKSEPTPVEPKIDTRSLLKLMACEILDTIDEVDRLNVENSVLEHELQNITLAFNRYKQEVAETLAKLRR